MIIRLRQGNEILWLKRYNEPLRRFRLRALDWFVTSRGIDPLRPPPRRSGAAARKVEERRLMELREKGVHVPEVVAAGHDTLLLSDLGQTLSERLATASGRDGLRLTDSAVEALVRVHSLGGYLGQPQARNITVDGQDRVGFIDFEEDPKEIMSLSDAQARDWLLFAAGTSRYRLGAEEEFARQLHHALASEPEAVRERIDRTVRRLGFLDRLTRHLGRRARGLGAALRVLRSSLLVWWLLIGLLVGIGVDMTVDGELDLAYVIGELAY